MYDAAYQGSRGAFSEEAALNLLTPQAKLLPRETLEDVFSAVTRGDAHFGVIPIENTLAGTIHGSYDLLFEHDLKIIGETVRPIQHTLIAPPGVSMKDVRRVMSHPVALAQCEHFFRSHLEIQRIAVYDTAGAVENVIRDNAKDAAAVASRRCAEIYGGVILAEAIQDHPENYTRFLLITPSASASLMADNPAPAEYKTTIVFSTANIPGALHESLRAFAKRGIDLSKIESRPLRGARFEYLFYLDVIGRADVAPVLEALADLTPKTLLLRVLGTYPRFKG